jgi:ATP-dependent DNA ligase
MNAPIIPQTNLQSGEKLLHFAPPMKGLVYEPEDRTDKKGKLVKKTILPWRSIGMPKLNGIRMRWIPQYQALFTNSGIKVGSMDHVVEQIMATKFMKYLPLDGEAYNHEAYVAGLPFQEINGRARRKKTDDETRELKFNIFDFAEFNETQLLKIKRLRMIEQLMEDVEPTVGDDLVRVPYAELSMSEIAPYNAEALRLGYEGIMICHPHHVYVSGKGGWMWKWKPAYDQEYKFVRLVPALEGRNMATFAAIEVMMDNGKTFCLSGISDDMRKKLFKNPPAPGTPITVEYGDKSADDVPIFPRFKDVRWDQ